MTLSISISTKNRCEDLLFTLDKIYYLLNENITCVVFDDGSTDGTYEKTKHQFPNVVLHRNEISRGYLYCRNKMLNEAKSDYVISLDDDAHFISDNPLQIIEDYFFKNPKCGVIAARIIWTNEAVNNLSINENPMQVKSFVGCGHIWRMSAWREIPSYPEWFEFYGEESYASYQLFKKKWEVHYLPQLFVQHRVNLKERSKSNNDIAFRYRRSLRSGWYNYFLFYPLLKIPKEFSYSLWMQLKKIFKGNFNLIKPLSLALIDVIIFFPKIVKQRNSLSVQEFNSFQKLKEAEIFWKPKEKN